MVVTKQPKNNQKNDFEKTAKEGEDLNEKDLKKDALNEEIEKDGVDDENEKNDENLELKNLKEELNSFKEIYLRLKAEFDNFKKRTQKEKSSIYDMAKSDCVAPFLEVLDNLERALGLVEKKDQFSEGIDLVVNKFYDVLKKIGVCEIKSFGEVFDPKFHEAIKVVQDEKFEKNVICEVLQKGFILNDVVLRHSLVVAANP